MKGRNVTENTLVFSACGLGSLAVEPDLRSNCRARTGEANSPIGNPPLEKVENPQTLATGEAQGGCPALSPSADLAGPGASVPGIRF
jgi:hypothetical protein